MKFFISLSWISLSLRVHFYNRLYTLTYDSTPLLQKPMALLKFSLCIPMSLWVSAFHSVFCAVFYWRPSFLVGRSVDAIFSLSTAKTSSFKRNLFQRRISSLEAPSSWCLFFPPPHSHSNASTLSQTGEPICHVGLFQFAERRADRHRDKSRDRPYYLT